jgi:hypothetical protein
MAKFVFVSSMSVRIYSFILLVLYGTIILPLQFIIYEIKSLDYYLFRSSYLNVFVITLSTIILILLFVWLLRVLTKKKILLIILISIVLLFYSFSIFNSLGSNIKVGGDFIIETKPFHKQTIVLDSVSKVFIDTIGTEGNIKYSTISFVYKNSETRNIQLDQYVFNAINRINEALKNKKLKLDWNEKIKIQE